MLFFKKIYLIIFISFISACGSGGASDGGIVIDVSSIDYNAKTNSKSETVYRVTATSSKYISVGWTPNGGTVPSWLSYEVIERVNGRTVVDITVHADILELGGYSDSLRFETSDVVEVTNTHITEANIKYKDLPVNVVIQDSLVVSQQVLDAFSKGNVPGSYANPSIKIETANILWTATTPNPWIQLNIASGRGNLDLPVDFDLTGLAIGHHQGTVIINDANSDDSFNVQVDLYVDSITLEASAKGVSFSSLANAQHLIKMVTISNSANVPVDWSTSSDQAWLSASKINANDMAVSANPLGLADGMHYGVITVTSTEPDIEPTTINVGLYVSSSNALDINDISVSQFDGNNFYMVADPIRPYIYISNQTNTIYVYHTYTGNMIHQINDAAFGNNMITSLEVSENGDSLYIYLVRTSPNELTKVLVYDLNNSTITGEMLGGFYYSEMEMDYLLVDGAPLLAMANGEVFNLMNNTLAGNLYINVNLLTYEEQQNLVLDGPIIAPNNGAYIKASSNKDEVFIADCCNSGYLNLFKYDVKHSKVANKIHNVISDRVNSNMFSGTRDFAISHDGQHVYTASSGIKDVSTENFDLGNVNTSMGVGGWVFSIDSGVNGKVFASGGNSSSPIAIQVYDQNRTNLGVISSISGLGVQQNGLVVSSDGLRLVVMSSLSANQNAISFKSSTP